MMIIAMVTIMIAITMIFTIIVTDTVTAVEGVVGADCLLGLPDNRF